MVLLGLRSAAASTCEGLVSLPEAKIGAGVTGQGQDKEAEESMFLCP